VTRVVALVVVLVDWTDLYSVDYSVVLKAASKVVLWAVGKADWSVFRWAVALAAMKVASMVVQMVALRADATVGMMDD